MSATLSVTKLPENTAGICCGADRLPDCGGNQATASCCSASISRKRRQAR